MTGREWFSEQRDSLKWHASLEDTKMEPRCLEDEQENDSNDQIGKSN